MGWFSCFHCAGIIPTEGLRNKPTEFIMPVVISYGFEVFLSSYFDCCQCGHGEKAVTGNWHTIMWHNNLI